MLSIVATLNVKDLKIEEAKALLKELRANAQENEPGTLAYVVHQKKDDETTFVVYEKYESMDAFKAHSANVAKQGARFADIIAGPPELVMLEEI